MHKSLTDRFWPRVSIGNGCWEWLGSTGTHGYGVIGTRGSNTVTTHRLAFMLCNGDIPEGRMVLHRCDNRRCVNPAHLYLGDAKQNAEDVRERGDKSNWNIRKYVTPEVEQRRIRNLKRGRGHHRSAARIDEQVAMQIFHSTGPQRAVGLKFGVSQQLVSQIKRKTRWSFIHGDA